MAAAAWAGGEYARAYRGVRCVVLGASGFIGQWLWRLLEAAGADVRPVSRRPEAAERVRRRWGLLAQPACVDLSEPGRAAQLVADLVPDVVFNAAGYGIDRNERDAALHRRINEELPAELAAALMASAPAGGSESWRGQRLLQLGSAFEYGSVPGRITEATEPAGTGAYAESKRAGTARLLAFRRQTGLRAAVVRVATVYGPGERPTRLVPTLLRAARTGQSIELTPGEQERDFTYVGDVAEGLLRLGQATSVPPLIHLATGRLHPVREFVAVAMRVAGIAPGQVRLGAQPYRADEVWQGPFSVELLSRTLGWVPGTDIETGIRATLACALAEPDEEVRVAAPALEQTTSLQPMLPTVTSGESR